MANINSCISMTRLEYNEGIRIDTHFIIIYTQLEKKSKQSPKPRRGRKHCDPNPKISFQIWNCMT